MSGPQRWGAATPEATREEIDANRRSERYVAFAGVAGAVLTVGTLLLVAVTR